MIFPGFGRIGKLHQRPLDLGVEEAGELRELCFQLCLSVVCEFFEAGQLDGQTSGSAGALPGADEAAIDEDAGSNHAAAGVDSLEQVVGDVEVSFGVAEQVGIEWSEHSDGVGVGGEDLVDVGCRVGRHPQGGAIDA